MRQSKPLTFGELAEGDTFIAFPQDGDDEGHGGYRSGSFVFRKVGGAAALRLESATVSTCPTSMQVLKVFIDRRT
jgi:hypothetical protein